MTSIPVSVGRVETFRRSIRTRMPFRFGNAVMESMDVAYARVETSIGGTDTDGIAAQILSPLWFDKDPQVSFDAKNQRLLRAIAIAADIYNATGQGSLSVLHREVSSATAERCAGEGINALTASFGVALIETALFHALCSATATNFHQALLADLPGLGEDFVSSLPSKPTPRMAVRHTVGLTDPVIDTDIEEPLGDGLPQTLSDIIARHGVRYFKIKIARETEPTIERLCHIASLLDTTAGDYAVTLDANEQFEDMGEFHAFVQAFSEEPRLRSFWDRMLLFEQPVHRDEALSPEVAEPLREIGKARPVIIDESDATDETLMLALELGYAGCSAKSCKGVWRSLDHHRLLSAPRPDGSFTGILSAEDLTCPAIFPLQQDLCVVAALGIKHCERNAHHYIRGLDHLTETERDTVLREFPSLYERKGEGPATLKIIGGDLDLREVNSQGFGTLSPPQWEQLEPLPLPGILS